MSSTNNNTTTITNEHHSDMMIISSSSSSSTTTSTFKNSILGGDLPVFNSKNFSKPNPRSHLNPPKLLFNHSKPKQIVSTERVSLLQRSFEKLNQNTSSSNSSNPNSSSSSSSNNLKRGNDSNLNEKPTKLLKYN